MVKRVTLTTKQKVDIIHAYADTFTPMIELAKKYGITRQGVFKILKQAGVDTSKRRLPVSCDACGTEVLRTKARIRRQLHHFCSEDCYYAFLQAGNGFPYIASHYGQRLGRSIVSQHFALQDGNIVHHEDRNELNNVLSNLRVFACNGDHVRYHRGFDVKPIWDGRNAIEYAKPLRNDSGID